MISPRFLLSFYTLISVMAVVLFAGHRDNQTATPTYTADKTYKITVLQTNDDLLEQFHSSNSLAMAERKRLVDDIRKKVENDGGKVILLSGGDISASIASSSLSNLDELQYNAMVVSPHQFDYPLKTIRQQQDNAGFPFLSANIFGSETGKSLFDAYTIVNVDGLSIAIMGLTADYLPKAESRKNFAGISILDPVEIAQELAPQLKSQFDIVIASTHMGHNPDASAVQAQILADIDDIDLVLGDHSQDSSIQTSLMQKDSAKEDAVQAVCGLYITRVDLEFRNGQLTVLKPQKMAIEEQYSTTSQQLVHSFR